LTVAATALAPGPIGGGRQAPANPIGLPGGERVLSVAEMIGGVALFVAIFGSGYRADGHRRWAAFQT
jgi:hypothetical protein